MFWVLDSLLIFGSSLILKACHLSFQSGKSIKRFSLVIGKCLISLLILIFLVTFPAQASFCKSVVTQKVCILSIDRSAKKYWEYQAQLMVDNIVQPRAVYNCRENLWLQPNGKWEKFADGSANAVACSLFRR